MSQTDFPEDFELPEEVDETTSLRRSSKRSTTSRRRRSTYSGTRRRTSRNVSLARCLQDLCAYFFNIKLPQRFFTLLKSLFVGSRRK